MNVPVDVVEKARFSSAFTFQYSPRPGTPAATMPDQIPKAVVQERYERLVALQEEMSLLSNQEQVGAPVELLIAAGEGRKNAQTERMSGRARDGRLVHFRPAGTAESPIDAADLRPDVIFCPGSHYTSIAAWAKWRLGRAARRSSARCPMRWSAPITCG